MNIGMHFIEFIILEGPFKSRAPAKAYLNYEMDFGFMRSADGGRTTVTVQFSS